MNQVGDTGSECLGLAGAGPRNHAERAVHMLGRGALLGIERARKEASLSAGVVMTNRNLGGDRTITWEFHAQRMIRKLGSLFEAPESRQSQALRQGVGRQDEHQPGGGVHDVRERPGGQTRCERPEVAHAEGGT